MGIYVYLKRILKRYYFICKMAISKTMSMPVELRVVYTIRKQE